MDPAIPTIIAIVAILALALGAVLDDRRARVRRREQAAGLDIETVLPLLHSINDDRCIGCEACIDVCPTEVLDLINHKVAVSRFSDCVQCEQCANSCPTQALVMYREGTTPRMLTVPELDENFQTGIPGQYLIGEVAGKPLVKNAANLGRAVIEHIRRELAGTPSPGPDILDVVVVGSGPAGLSAGLACLKYGLRCTLLEKEHVISSTVSRYPKGKTFMAEPCDAENVSFLPVFDGTKEELVAAWERVIAGVKLPVKLGEAVETVKRGDDGIFQVRTTVATYRTRRVVLATGLRGKPRLLAVPGANLEKVQSLLDDPAEFAGEHVLVVGGGDSAVEGAMALAAVGATVTLSYRGDGFKRCKQGNQKRLAELTASGQIALHLESNVAEFTADAVRIKLKDGTTPTLPNTRAFVLIGADTPVVWLEANNVRFIERPHLYALGSTEEVVRRIEPAAEVCPRSPEQAISVLQGHTVHKSPGRRMLSVVDHIRDEFQEVVTSVSVAFRLSDLEAVSRNTRARTPVFGVPTSSRKSRPAPFIPAARLAARAVNAEQTVTRVSPFGDAAEERTSVGGSALRPRARRRDGTGSSPVIPAHSPPMPELQANSVAISDELDNAFDRAFAEPAAAARPRPGGERANPFDDEGATILEHVRHRLP
jgi:thioredoxin reductase/ferredoxin